jgi:hypothetical protein
MQPANEIEKMNNINNKYANFMVDGPPYSDLESLARCIFL